MNNTPNTFFVSVQWLYIRFELKRLRKFNETFLKLFVAANRSKGVVHLLIDDLSIDPAF